MTLEKAIFMGLTILATGAMIVQCRKPRWGVGRLYAAVMNRSHGALTAWGLKHVAIEKGYTILDMGCGGGRTIRTLAAMATEGKVHGADYSADSVAVARRTNAESIAAGRVEIVQSSVSSLPFADGMFDLVTAVETHYYWPQPVSDLQELRRVLKPGGRIVIIAEAYRRRKYDAVALIMKMLGGSCLSVREHEELLAAAGYAEVETFEAPRMGWFCAVARRVSA
ncbi:MAG TPA: class I SAM-dependent methyltransferase [Thermoanaerobaculia bacterium]